MKRILALLYKTWLLTSLSVRDMVRKYEIQAFEQIQSKKNYDVLL